MAKAKYLVLKGISTPTARYEPGEVTDDIPGASITWLIEEGAIEHVTGSQSKSAGKRGAATRAAKAEGAEIADAFEEAVELAEGTQTPPEEAVEEALQDEEEN